MTSGTSTSVVEPMQECSLKANPRWVTILFACTSLLSAFLLFQVQLVVSKYILPWFGGSAAVWTTSMLTFQLLLLAGYFYSHTISVRLRPAAQARLHVVLLTVGSLLVAALSLVWPTAITPSSAWKPVQGEDPAFGVASFILVSVGLPFLLLSTTGPLLQAWFARLGGGARTYKLYSVSNLGSLLGLLSFPFLIEPALRMRAEGKLWSLLFCVFALGCGLCAWQTLKRSHPSEEHTGALPSADKTRPNRLAYVLWFLLAACASALLLATTNLLCQEVITVPLLWVLPLSLYLMSFILAFDHPRWYQRAAFHPLFALSLLGTCAAMAFDRSLAQMVALPVLLFVTCMICHGELSNLKPGIRDLTSFYLAVSAGGAAGGVFVGIVAPRMFSSLLEFQLSLGLTIVLVIVALVVDQNSWIFRSDCRLPIAIVAGTLLAAYAGGRWLPPIAQLLEDIRYYPLALLIGTVAVMGAFIMKEEEGGVSRRRFRFVQILVAGLTLCSFAALYRSTLPKPGLHLSSRSFYGTLRVFRQIGSRELVHGHTIHGSQLDPPMDRFPTTYYGPQSGIGVVLRNHPKRSTAPGTLRVGIVGLGAGTLAAYGHAGDSFRYYEIDPDVVKLSSGEDPVFTYVRQSAAGVSVVLGDARLSLERESKTGIRQRFDVLVLDAFSGDAIPVHLLTREAFETYWQQVDPDAGIIAVHITSQHVNLYPVLQGIGAHFGIHYIATVNKPDGPVVYSCWVLMARDKAVLRMPGLEQLTAQYVSTVGPRLWTDDYSDIFRLIY